MTSGAIRFPAAQGHALAHCSTCSKESKAAAYISQALAARGIAVLRFDFSEPELAA